MYVHTLPPAHRFIVGVPAVLPSVTVSAPAVGASANAPPSAMTITDIRAFITAALSRPTVRRSSESLAKQPGVRRDVARVLGEEARVKRLRAVAERGVGVLVDLDDDAVGAHGGGRARQR